MKQNSKDRSSESRSNEKDTGKKIYCILKKWMTGAILVMAITAGTVAMKSLETEALAAEMSRQIDILYSQQACRQVDTPYGLHGSLRVAGTQVVDQTGEPFQLRGVSTHGLAWYPQYVSEETFHTLRDDWKVNTVRLALYPAEYGGYCTGGDQQQLRDLVDCGVTAATELGLYVVIDWHILSDGNPNTYRSQALEFFREMSERYRDHKNVIYEICNEPNGGTDWNQIRDYAREVIDVIRANAPDSLIIVGTPTWSQDVDAAAKAPLEAENLLYALHFYAGTHGQELRSRAQAALDQGLPLIVSEFGITEASGNGHLDQEQATAWLTWLDQNQTGYLIWNLSNKAEASALIRPSTAKTAGWSCEELSESGQWYYDWLNRE